MSEIVLRVSELTDIIKSYMEDQIGTVTITGEISNFKPHYSGHRYFTLKDELAQISCVMWKSRRLDFIPKEGMNVKVKGNLSVYGQRGTYQLDIIYLSPIGMGDLYMAFEEMKAKLEKLGYFAGERKRLIPNLPLKIGISTSPTGAAVQDMFSTIKRRFPYAIIYFRPTIVQGNDAAKDISNAIEDLNKTDADILIVGRGGGSIEDLWAYNTEIVANAIFNSKIPVISAVGHETDFTIADFVADKRAATPTAAAELATPFEQTKLLNFLDTSIEKMEKLINRNLNLKYQMLDDLWKESLQKKVNDKIIRTKDDLNKNIKLLQTTINRNLDNKNKKLDYLTEILKKSNPNLPLEKGFAIIKHNGKIINLEQSLTDFKFIEIQRKNETVNAKIEQSKNTSTNSLF